MESDWRQSGEDRGDAVGALISAAIFGLFGFYMLSWTQPTTAYTVVAWSLRAGCVGFAIAGLMMMARLTGALVVHAVVSAGTAIAFGVGGAWVLWISSGHDLNGYLLIVFAIYNSRGIYRDIRKIGGRK